jgi:hypothetical protein
VAEKESDMNTQEDKYETVNFGHGIQVAKNNIVLAPTFNDKGAALAFISGLKKGRKPV